LPDPPGVPALTGTFAHRVLEVLLGEDPSERTIDRAKQIAREVWPETAADPDFVALGLDDAAERDFRWKGWIAVAGLWTIEDPTAVRVDSTELDIEVEIGGVPFRGIVDRIDLADDGRIISDYKSGRAPAARFAADRLTQVLLYAAAVQCDTGAMPARARLLYLGQKIVDIDVTSDNIAEAVTELQDTWHRLNAACDSGEFEANTGPLCGWCPFVERCAEGSTEVQQRVNGGRMRLDAPAVDLVAREEAAALVDLLTDTA
jgi:putative RecB family exonuclease